MSIKQQIFDQHAYTLGCLADEPETDDPECRARILRACANGMREAAIGYARYEALRLLNVAQFSELYWRNLAGENFDAMVDAMAAGL